MDWDQDVASPAVPALPSDGSLSGVVREIFTATNEVAGADFDQFRDVLNSHFYPASVEPLDQHPALVGPALSALHLRHMTIAHVRFGAAARVDPGDLTGYHVNVPLRGIVLSGWGDQRISASPREAAVFSPGAHTMLARWEPDATQLCIKLNRNAVETELAGLLGHSVTRPIEFDLGFPLDRGAGLRWTSLLTTLLQHAHAARAGHKGSVVELLERSLLTDLVMAQRHSYSEELNAEAQTISNREVAQVVELVQRAPESPYTVSDLARAAGVSARSLQASFHKHMGVSPMAYLRQVRLERAHEDLQLGRGRVSEVAYHWGFTNLGRFATLYQERFGELPSATIARL
ncbi:AraC family transcriptional regulator [Nocardioides sp. LHG3406-4]|uniref:AraC family transcriptional regulator n=1 Tax=Nocardioides sp. LHG3406-4 TaxID=2804575 RepID=UPI003CEB34D9